MSAITILVCDAPVAAPIVDLLGAWTAAGLCRTFLVVDACAEGGTSAHRPVTVHDDEGAHEDELFRWLSENHRTVVRILSTHVQATTAAVASATTVVERAVDVAADVAQRLGEGQEYFHVNLFVPAEGVVGVNETALRLDVDINVVVAAEDRAAPATFAFPVTGVAADGSLEPRFVTHAAMNVAATGALWSQMKHGPFDTVSQAGGFPQVRVIRSFLRLLDGEDPIPSLISVALNPTDDSGRAKWPVPSDPRATEASTTGPLLERALADAFGLGDGMFRFSLPPRRSSPPKTLISIMQAFKMLFTFMWEEMRDEPRQVFRAISEKAVRRVNRLATGMTTGDNSQILVRLGGRLTRDDLVIPTLDASSLVEESLSVMDLMDGVERYLAPSYGSEWDDLRTAMFSLVDGSTMPQGFDTPSLGDRRPVVLDVSSIAVDPATPPLVLPGVDVGLPGQGQVVLSPFDPYATDRLITYVSGLPPTDEQGSKDRESALGQLRAWQRDRRRALLWELGSRAGDELEKARKTLVEALEIIRRGRPRDANEDKLRGERRRTFRWILAAFALAVVSAIAVWFGLRAAGVALALVVLAVFACFVLWLIGAAWRYAKYLRLQFEAQYQYERWLGSFEQAADDVVVCGHEMVRLGSVYWQFVRWNEAIAYILHRPWGAKPSGADERSTLTIADAPLACRVGSASVAEEKLKPIAAHLRSAIFVVGWLRNAFRESEGLAMHDLAAARALDHPLTLLEDQLQASNGALDGLLDLLRSGSHWRATVVNRTSEARDEVCRRRPAEIFGPVTLSDQAVYPDAIAPVGSDPVDGLLLELLGEPDATRPEPLGRFGEAFWQAKGAGASPEVATSIEIRPDALGRGDSPSILNVTAESLPPAWRPGRMLYTVVRVDSAEHCEPPEIVLFGEIEDNEPAAPKRPLPEAVPKPPTPWEVDDDGD